MINNIKRIINPLNIDIVRYPNVDLRRRRKLFRHYGINKVLDVGANTGQYAQLIRKLGFNGKIISFEPLKSSFNELEKKASKDNNWTALNYGLGSKEEERILNISKNSYSSSILEITSKHVENAPLSSYFKKEIIKISTIDNLYEDLVSKDDIILLKIDVQGFEKEVLEGTKQSLSKIKGLQVEMSITELYKGEMLFMEMINFLKSNGFELKSLENGFYNDKTGQLLQVDGIFFRDNQ